MTAGNEEGWLYDEYSTEYYVEVEIMAGNNSLPERGDAVERWLKIERDSYSSFGDTDHWEALDSAIGPGGRR